MPAGIVGSSDALRNAVERADKVAPYSVPVLIGGETGTGKELFARLITIAASAPTSPSRP